MRRKEIRRVGRPTALDGAQQFVRAMTSSRAREIRKCVSSPNQAWGERSRGCRHLVRGVDWSRRWWQDPTAMTTRCVKRLSDEAMRVGGVSYSLFGPPTPSALLMSPMADNFAGAAEAYASRSSCERRRPASRRCCTSTAAVLVRNWFSIVQ
jgi:hypothetical protein